VEWDRALMRYFFHLRKGPEEILDHEGIELEECAIEKLNIDRIVDEIRSEGSEFLDTKGWSVRVVDENGRSIIVLPL
jgi:hypothetical protein